MTLLGWDALGTRIEVFWSRANTFRRCTISSFDPSTLRHKCEYDDVEGSMFRNGEKIIREEWLPLFRPGTLVRILKECDEEEIVDEAKRNTIIEIAVKANALKKRHREASEMFELARNNNELKGVERCDWLVGLEKHSGMKASSRRSSQFARAPVAQKLPEYLVGTTKMDEIIKKLSATSSLSSSQYIVNKVLFTNCQPKTSLVALAGLQFHLANQVKVVCQIDLASIIERGDGDCLLGTQRILHESLIKTAASAADSSACDNDDKILLLLPKLETWALAAEIFEGDPDGGGHLTTSKAFDCVCSTVEDAIAKGITNIFVAATCAFDEKHLPRSVRNFFLKTKDSNSMMDVLDEESLSKKLSEELVSEILVPTFFKTLFALENNNHNDDVLDSDSDSDSEEAKESANFILLKRLQKENDLISSELRLLKTSLIRLDRLKPFFESDAGKFWKDVDANTCLTSVADFLESLKMATAKITRGRNPKFILGKGKKMALRSAAAYCVDLVEEFYDRRGLFDLQKRKDEIIDEINKSKLKSVDDDDDDDDDDCKSSKMKRRRKTKQKTEERNNNNQNNHHLLKIKRSIYSKAVETLSQKILHAQTGSSSPLSSEEEQKRAGVVNAVKSVEEILSLSISLSQAFRKRAVAKATEYYQRSTVQRSDPFSFFGSRAESSANSFSEFLSRQFSELLFECVFC